ncbi:unnamed protein product [Hermetia illucens]|uniref:Uncharacterized protein n=1 Tax=Hermetia illucens TaxID=343691 RepID=A0A7R8UWF8_HERIL|nr:unnamed protein product [Hermetia illucens]
MQIPVLTLNITKLEYDQIDKRIDIVNEQQQELMLTTIAELQQHFTSISSSIPNVTLPKTDEPQQIFRISPAEKEIVNGSIALHYRTPLTHKQPFVEQVVISPSDNYVTALVFDNGKPICRMIMSIPNIDNLTQKRRQNPPRPTRSHHYGAKSDLQFQDCNEELLS